MFGRNNKLDTGWLADVALFDGFSQEQLSQVAELGQRVVVAAGSEIADQGRIGKECWVVVEGTANIVMNGEYITSVGAGSMIGEMALLEHRPRSAAVIADTDMVLVSFDTDGFNAILDKNPVAKDRVSSILTRRLSDNLNRRSNEG
jgi:CRP-like cAMP-binding protein